MDRGLYHSLKLRNPAGFPLCIVVRVVLHGESRRLTPGVVGPLCAAALTVKVALLRCHLCCHLCCHLLPSPLPPPLPPPMQTPAATTNTTCAPAATSNATFCRPFCYRIFWWWRTCGYPPNNNFHN